MKPHIALRMFPIGDKTGVKLEMVDSPLAAEPPLFFMNCTIRSMPFRTAEVPLKNF
jgi:hypothetical protein